MLVSQEKAYAIKDQLKQEQDAWQNKPRYGVFSYQSNHGFGHRDQQAPLPQRDEKGRVQTAPRNFMGGRPRTAAGKDAFTQCGYLSQNDEYMEPNKAMRYRDQNPSKVKDVHGGAFRPSGSNAKKVMAPYPYLSDSMDPTQSAPGSRNIATDSSSKNLGGAAAGAGAAGPALKNFVTCPVKKGKGNTTVGHLFSGITYETDPYDFPNQLNSAERKDHAGKIRSGAFFTTFKKRDHFTPNMYVYRDPSGMSATKKKLALTTSGLRPFLNSNPPRKGYNCTINRFPDYAEEGEYVAEHRRVQTASGLWRPTYREKSVPTVSIQQYNAQNRPRHKF